MKPIYDGYKQEYMVIDRRSTEMIKYASNNFLALKISFINEISNLCELVGANIEDVSKGMGKDFRIGKDFLNAGVGYGGSCLTKDTKALQCISSSHNYELKTIKAITEVNENQKLKLIEKARKYYNSFKGVNISILGLTFKPDTDDLRESISIKNISKLIEEDAIIKVYDPKG